jgi:dolichol kinase
VPEFLLKYNLTQNLRAELGRKSIHLSCTLLPLAYHFFLTREQILWITGIITLGFIIAEFVRLNSEWGNGYFLRIFGPLLRDAEKGKQLTGATYLFVSLSATFLIFGREVAVPSALMLTVADALAAVIGKSIGERPFLDKSLAGSATFCLSGLLILFIFSPQAGWNILVLMLVLTIVEAKNLPVNDNVSVPLLTGFGLQILLV